MLLRSYPGRSNLVKEVSNKAPVCTLGPSCVTPRTDEAVGRAPACPVCLSVYCRSGLPTYLDTLPLLATAASRGSSLYRAV